MLNRKIIEVVAAIIRYDGKYMVCSRPKHTELGKFLEFPGGKVEPGESQREALKREIREELGVEIEVGACFWRLDHDYGEKYVRVTFYEAVPAGEDFHPVGKDNQDIYFVNGEEMASLPFLPADLPLAETITFLAKKAKSLQ